MFSYVLNAQDQIEKPETNSGNIEVLQMTVDVKANLKNEFVVVESIKTKKKLWIKNIKMIESKEYDILVQVYTTENGGRVYGKILFFDFSSRQKTLNLREAAKEVKTEINTKY